MLIILNNSFIIFYYFILGKSNFKLINNLWFNYFQKIQLNY